MQQRTEVQESHKEQTGVTKLPTETTVSANERLLETEQELKCQGCNSFRSPNRQSLKFTFSINETVCL